jgi:hypothetical protein
MKTRQRASNPSPLQPVDAALVEAAKSAVKPFCLSLVFGTFLMYAVPPAQAEAQQKEVPSMETGKIQEQTGQRQDAQDAESRRGTSPHMDKGASSGNEPRRPDTTLDTEKMNQGSAPNTENINEDTVSPGGDNMMRDAIPGGSGLNRQ